MEELHPLLERVRALRADRRVGAALFACLAVAAGFAWIRAGAANGAPPRASGTNTTRTAREEPVTSTTRVAVVVDVVGAVRTPGVLHLQSGQRIVDAIAAAGGATADADVQQLNLAALLTDGERIAVPRRGETLPAPSATDGAAPAAGPVNLNTATADQLDALPGIGPATAAAIVSDRGAHGPFKSVDDLARVRGIGPAKLAQLRDLVTV